MQCDISSSNMKQCYLSAKHHMLGLRHRLVSLTPVSRNFLVKTLLKNASLLASHFSYFWNSFLTIFVICSLRIPCILEIIQSLSILTD